VKRYGLRVEICVGPVTNEEACKWEIDMIAQENAYSTNHSHDDPIDIRCNFTFGGDGSSGNKRPDLAERNRANRGNPSPLKGRKLSPEQCKAIGEKSKDRTPWNKGKKCPEISDQKKGVKRPDLAARNRANAGKKRSPESIAKQIESMTGKKRGPYKRREALTGPRLYDEIES
jgi:hypothetical protein